MPHLTSHISHPPSHTGRQFTARTAYIVNGPRALDLFLTVRDPDAPKLGGTRCHDKTL